MPDYTLTDTVTGETISVTGDSPPTPQDAEELFQAYYERERTAAGQALETAKGVGRGFANAFLSAGEGLAELADAGTNAIGLEDLIDSGEENDLVRAAREGRAAIEESMGADAAYRDQWLTKFGEGVGSFASFFTPTAAVRLAGLAGKGIQASRAVQAAELGAAGTLAAGTGAGDQAQRIQAARDAGLDVSEGQEDAAIVGGTIVGLSELATPVRLLRRLRGLEAGDQLPSGISQRLRSALMSGTVEGVQEVTASLLQDAVEKGVYNEALEVGGGNLMDDFTIGGAIGAGADLVLNAVAGRRNKDAFKSSEEAERKKREDLEDAQNQRQANLPKDLAEQADIDAQSNLDVKAAAEARRQAAGAEVDPAQIAPPTGRALTTKLKTPARIVNISDASGQTFQAEEKTRIRNKGKPTEQVTTFVEVPGGGEVITSVNGVPQQTGLQITTVAEPTAGIQRRYPKQPMLAYAQQIRQTMGDSFPSADNSFTVNLPQEFGGALGDTTQLDEAGAPVFTVQDSSGQQFGIPLNNSEDAFALAGFLNDEIINDNVFSAGDAVISTSPEAYDTDQASTLQAYNFAVNHPDSNTYTSVAVDSAAETTQDRGFDEVADVKTLVENRVGPSKMTASQRINAKRLRKGLPVTNNFTIEEVRSVLKEDQLYNLTDTRVNGLPETETYKADLSKAGNPIIRSSAGEVLQGRPLTVLEKDAEIKANPKKKPPKLVKFKTEADARVYANQLNNATGKAAVEKGVMRNVDGNFQEMQSLLEAKNITSKVGSPEVKYLASRILGKKTVKSVNDLSVAEARLLYQRLRSLPRFDKPTKLPTFKLPKYTGAQFRAAVQALQENPNAGELALADATGINAATKSGAESMQELRKDIAKQGVKPVAPVEPVVEQQQETLALPAPSVDVDRLRSAIKKVMTGFGLKDVGLSLDYALRTAVKDPLGNLVYGIRPRQGGDIDADVIGGEAALAREAKIQLVRSDQADPEDRAEAYYDPRINTIFLSIDKAMQGKTLTDAQVEAELLALLDHEMIHAMRKLDLFTNKEWNLLSRAASKKIHPTKDRDGNPQTFLKWAQNNYDDLSPVDQVEESVAELVRRAREDSKLLQGKPRSLVERIARFFRNMVSALRGEQFNTFSEVIGGIGSGTIGGRQRGEIRTLAQTEKDVSRTLAKPPPGTVITTGEEAERDAAMQGQSVPDFSRRAVGAPQTEVRPEVADAYSKLQSGEFTRQQYDSVVLGTIEPYDFVPEPATTEEMFEALAVQSQKDKINAEVPDGSRVGLRLDINAYKNFGTWVPTIHDQKGKSISHMATASIKNADFTMLRERAGRDPKNLQEDARAVMEGKNKFPFAQIMGDFVNRDPEQTASLAEEFINSPDWIQVGFDPRRHSYFYDRKTGEPVTFAEEVIQVGPLVLAKSATKNVLPSGEQFETLFSRRAPTEAEMGINVRTDGDTNYADLIVSGQKKYETRDKDSLRPYVGKRIGIVETGSGPAKLVGYATVGEPIEVGEAEFADSRDQHLVPEGSKFDIKPGQSKFLYEMIDPEQLAQPIDASGTKGIVARNISQLGDEAVPTVDEELPMFSRRAPEQSGIEGNVSTRYPTGAKSTEDPLDDLLVNDYQTFVNDKIVFKKNMALIKDSNLYPILQKASNLRTDEQKAEAFVELVKGNLLNLFDRVPPDTRQNSKLWYKGANALVRRFADRHGLSMEQASAVAANLSPQKDWYQNASLAERTIDIYFNNANQPFTQEMKDRAEELFFHKGISAEAQAENRVRLELIGSSTLSEILRKFNEPGLSDTLAAMWIRTFDQTYHDPSYRIVSPDGRLLDYAKNADGSNSKVAWGSLVEIAKGIRALQDADIDTISASLGGANKVRNFYNNIFDPDSDLGFVTIDTHAVAAGLLKPLGGSAFEVSHNFGTKGSSSKITGLNGVYSLYEEAYRRAANERGVLPREMQSITWEAVRGLFRPEYKSQKSNVKVVDNIWKQYNKKLITLDQAREAVYEHAQDINPPDWERSSGGIPEGDEASTYEKKLPDSGVSRPRSESATGRGRGGDAARPIPTEDVGLPFNLLDKYKRREVIGQSEVDRVVADNLQIAENRPAGTVPRFNPGADPYAQAVAADPDKGQELSDSEMPAFSRSNAPEINPAAQAAIDNVVADLPTNTPGQTYLNVLDQGPIAKRLAKLKQGYVNRYAQLENYQGMLGNLLADSSSLAAALMADRSSAITAAALQYGVPVYTGGMTKIADFNHTNSRGETRKIRGLIDLMSMLYTKEHGSLEQMAQAYSIAKRSERLRAKGIAVPGTPADHAANIATAESFLDENGNSIVKDWYDAWQDYNGYTVQFLKDTGVVDAETAEMWQDQSDYVPFYRQVEGADTPNAPNIFGGLTASADLKAIKGSEKEVNVPLLEAISMNLNAAISMGMKNVAQQRIIRDMRNIGLAREVKPGQNTTGEAVVTFKVNGNRRKFIVDDPLIYESLTVEPAGGVEREVAKILGFPSRFLREMVTREPGFVIANMLRDSLSAFVTSGSSFVPIADTIAGYAEGMEKLERTGVVGGYDYKNDPENIGEYAGKILQKRNKNVDQRGLLSKFFIGAWDLLGQATTRSDAATRNAVYNDVLARTGNEAEASYQAMEVLNFGRRGSSPVMRLVTATIPFLNARIQGLDVLARAGTGKSSANRDLSRSQAAMSFIARGSLIAASTAIYYTMVSDDEQYKEQTEEIKDNYWLIPTPSGVPVRIPIPFEVGLIFKTLPERIIDSYNEGTTAREAQQSIGRAVFGTLGVQFPQAVTPIMEAYMNYDLYTGRPVTPVFIESSLPPELQELASTTEVAKNMAKVLGISPIKLDHLMKGYGGTIGSYILGMADYGLRGSFLQGDNRAVLAGTDVSQYPIIRRFFASEFGAGNKEDFYEMWDYIKRTENAAKLLQDQGRFDELESFLVNKKQFIGLRKQLQPTASALADLRKQRRTLLKSDLTADQKQEQMRFINTQEQYYLSIVPQLERYIELPTATETIANRISNLL